ncbi:hypothetical protein H2199_005748 [Coniosporium tulheliwenetii]|uniref:Uncharacterized protein n=1 Tax=Coniosporium tulheliwenetii TaxID=3383036 RepID=A0ACC2Z0G3_9PEZI|nr:hypothetical protein H2199_005748 [Cladosporium sp. JES 115]
MYEEEFLGYRGSAHYGYDNVTLGLNGAGLPTLQHQVIAGFGTKGFYLGILGISPLPLNFTTLDDPQLSLLGTSENEAKIPSHSWGYTAGAYYREPKVFGSLTLGGYDLTRFVANDVTVALGADQSRDLLIGIQSITLDTPGSPPLLSTGIYSFINSMVSHIWLPVEVCQAFERAFNLTWSDIAEMYLVDHATHAAFVAQNPTITFKLGQSSTGGSSVDIVMLYKAFDLATTALDFNGSIPSGTRYFPLKRAQNSTQYTLGRTFLQEAYVIADYERGNFSVSQALFPATSVA